MPPAANIEINGAAASDDDLPINTLVQLSNADVGGEVTYFWEILDQPEGTADVLSSSGIENPTFTPKKEGSYLLRLTVNDTLATEVTDTKISAVRYLRTNEREIAAMETVEVDPALGWKPAVNRQLRKLNVAGTDANTFAALNPGASAPTTGDVVFFNATDTIKTGLPGEERLLVSALALATVAANVNGTLAVVTGTPSGVAPTINAVILCRHFGLVEQTEAGAPTVGDLVYVSDTAQPALVAGTNSRVIGRVVTVGGGAWRWLIDTTL
jgi:hypothetical protein